MQGEAPLRLWTEDGLPPQRRWRELYAESAIAMYTGFRRPPDRGPGASSGRRASAQPHGPLDYLVFAEASLRHDVADRLGDVRARTLGIGGDEDRLFPGRLQRETARRIPDAQLRLIEGAGHGASQGRKKDFDEIVKRFLSR